MAYGDPSPVAPVVSGVPSGGSLPPSMSLDSVAILQGVTTSQLAALNGPFNGSVVVTTGSGAVGDGNGAAFVWVVGDTTTANGTSVLGTGPYGRWRLANSSSGGGGSADTSFIFSNQANGALSDGGTVNAASVYFDSNAAARSYSGLLAPTSGKLVKVLSNRGSFDVTLQHNATTSAQKFINPAGVDYVLRAGRSVTLSYDTSTNLWRIAAQDAQSALSADVASTVANITSDALASVIGAAGQTALTTGKTTPGYGAHEFYWVPGDSTSDDGGLTRGSNVAGRWKSKWTRRTIYADVYLDKLDGRTQDAAVAALMSACDKSSSEIVFPGGDLVVTAQFTVPRGIHVHGNARRADSTSAQAARGENPTRFWWDSANAATAMMALSQFQRVEGIHFFAKPTRTLLAPWTFGQVTEVSGTFQPSGSHVSHCAVWGYGSFGSTTICGHVKRGFLVGPGLTANADYPRLDDCTIANMDEYGLDVAGGEPYHMELLNCTFAAEHIAAQNGYVMWGRAINLARSSSSLIATGCVFSRVEECVYLSGDAAFVKLIDCDVEYAKKILASPSGFYQARTHVEIHGRFELFSGLATANYAASDNVVIDTNYGVHLAVSGPVTTSDGTDALIGVGEHSTVELDANWGAMNPVRRRRVNNVPHSGGTFYKAKAYLPEADQYGLVLRPMIQTSGCENPDTFFDIGVDAARGSDATVVEMGFSPEEVDVPLITVSASTVSGTPAAGTWTVSNATTKGYRLTRSAAVGTGGLERVAVSYSLPNTDITPAAAVEAAFGSTTLMATAVNAGPIGNASGCWWQFVVSRFGANTGGIFHTICGAGNSNTGWVLIRNQNGGFYFSTNNIASVLAGEGTTITTPPMRTDLFTAVYTGTQLKTYVSGVLVQTVTGAFTPLTTERFRIGQNSQYDRPNTNSALHSMNYGTGVPTDTQVLAAAAQARKFGYTRPIAGAGLAEQNRYLFSGTGAATDVVGGASITLVSGTQPGTRFVRKAWTY